MTSSESTMDEEEERYGGADRLIEPGTQKERKKAEGEHEERKKERNKKKKKRKESGKQR